MTSTGLTDSGMRSVLILGGTSDIGVSIAEALVRDQAGPVVIAARDASRAEPVADRLRAAGATDAQFVHFDGGDVHRAAPAVAEAVATLGRIDIAIVAFGVFATSEDLRDDLGAALRMVEINLMGGIAVGEALSTQLSAQGSGTIVAVSSRGTEWNPGIIKVYKASKTGFDLYYQGLGAELAEVGARVLVVRPPGVNTRLITNQKGFLEPGEVADEVLTALAAGSTELTILSRFERRLRSRSLPRKVRDRIVHDLKRVIRRLR
jgi:decaprenylphospho-beta-D-erythro-pentofuranosid-2-ulose 2-reductase